MSIPNKSTTDFTWKITHFSTRNHIKGELIQSPTFTVKELLGTSWFLTFYPKGTLSSDAGFTSCFLIRSEKDSGPPVICCPYEIQVLIENEHVAYSKEDLVAQCNEISNGTRVGWDNYLQIDILEDGSKFFPDDTLCIRCRLHSLKCNSSEEMDLTQILHETSIGIDQIVFSWSIQDFCLCDTKYKIFEFSTTSKFALCFKKNDKYVSIYIQSLDGNSLHKKIVCNLSFLNIKGFKRDTTRAEHIFTAANECWTFPKLMEKTTLSDEKHYLKNGAITILFEFSIFNGTESVETDKYEDLCPVVVTESTGENKIDLLADIVSLYKCNKNWDVNLRSVGNLHFPAHKAILSARSPYFEALFKKFNENCVISFPTTEPRILKIFLRFLYSGIVDDLDYESAFKLLSVAVDWNVISLCEKCALILKTFQSVRNKYETS